MKFSSSVVAAAAAFLPLIQAHVRMCDPAPYGFNGDNAPLAPDGSNFPCKMPKGTLESTYSSVTGKLYTPGQAGQFELKGSAVHGGGSCQISITYDNPPKPDSTFKVIQSYEGSCPIFTGGNLPANPENVLPKFDVMIPEGLPAGPATFVWSWFNKIGNREMYMDCAPVVIGGSSSSQDAYQALPDMFVANIDNVPQNKCKTKEGVDILFPNPGKNVIRSKEACVFEPACGGEAPADNTGGNTGGDSGMYVPPAAPAPAPPAAPTKAPVAPGNGQGGVFIGVPSTVYDRPPAGEYTPIAGKPSTTMSSIAAKPTGSYGNGNDNGSSSGGSQEGSRGGSTGGSNNGSPSGPTDGGSSRPPAGPSYGNGNGSVPVGSTCDGSWIVKCDDADPTHFTLCYGKNQLAQKMDCNPGLSCKDIAAAHEGSYKNKFRRHAHEHIRRTLHKHRRH